MQRIVQFIHKVLPAPVRMLAALLVLFALAASSGSAGANAKQTVPGTTILILSTSVSGGTSSLEAQAAVALGFSVEIATPAQWATKTTADFASYRAIVLGDPTCGGPSTPYIGAAEANTAVWGPAVTGPVIINGTDPVFHYYYTRSDIYQVTYDSIAFAASDSSHTGAYVSLSCYYHGTAPLTAVPVLDAFAPAGFTVKGVGCYDNAHITATHPALNGLTDAILSNWSCSVHEAFDTWPVYFQVLAIARDAGSEYTAPDGTVGTPYILARGVTVISNIHLTPENATNLVGTPHLMTATVDEDNNPVVGTVVTFTVISGPSAGTTGTDVTDNNGEAHFTYTSLVPGTDYITAQYRTSGGLLQTSNTAVKEWVEATPTNTPLPVTDTPTPTNTPTRTATPAGTPCDVCNIYFSDTNISCNPDGTVHWSYVIRNNGSCTVTVPVKVQLQTRHGYSGRFTAVQTTTETRSFPPGLTTVAGDLCYTFLPDETFMNIYVKVNSTCHGGNADHKSPFIEVCTPNPTCTLNPAYAFSDVGADNPFAVAVRGITMVGGASGYSDGTFRPLSPVTRAQVAKMLVQAFELPLATLPTTSSAHFSDVSSNSPFYSYIEAAYRAGLVSGYSDGTYRPQNTVTRGQLAKMVVLGAMRSAGWKIVNPAKSSFTDVAAGSAYYTYIETALANGVISGSGASGAGGAGTYEPDRAATRGEAAQVIMLASTTQQPNYPNGVLNSFSK